MTAAVTLSVVILCSNANWKYSPRCTAPVAEIHQTSIGFYGTLESGVEWKQTNYGTFGKLEMEDVCWYVLPDGKTIYC